MNIIQLIPKLQTYGDGIGDYSLKLAEELLKKHGIFTQFLGYDRQIQTVTEIKNFPATVIVDRTPKTFLSLLPKKFDGIILHYNFVSAVDIALWLLKALQAAKKIYRFKLVIMFHELTLTEIVTPFKIFHPLHFYAAQGIAKIADSILTNNASSQKILATWIKQPVNCIPVISSVGEPETVPVLQKRDRHIIVFGSVYTRPQVYQKFRQDLIRSCQILQIKKIYDVGSPLKLKLSQWRGVEMVEMGIQPPEVISQLMMNCWAGFFDYSSFPGKLGKSTIFAAYCAHGLIPISSRYNPCEADQIYLNKHYVVADKQFENFNLAQLQAIANNARKWYSTHTVAQTAEVFASCLVSQV